MSQTARQSAVEGDSEARLRGRPDGVAHGWVPLVRCGPGEAGRQYVAWSAQARSIPRCLDGPPERRS
jgi:hypothetical protein